MIIESLEPFKHTGFCCLLICVLQTDLNNCLTIVDVFYFTIRSVLIVLVPIIT